MEPISAVGKTRFSIYGAILLCNLLVLILSAKVNAFQEFFYAADIFPFVLSIFTLIFMASIIIADFTSYDPKLSRPVAELSWLGSLTLLWLCFNAFSSNKWSSITFSMCNSVPSGFDEEKAWCQELLALRAFVWIEWVMFLLTFAYLLRYVMEGEDHIWSVSLSRYNPRKRPSRDSEFVQAGIVGGYDFPTWRKFN